MSRLSFFIGIVGLGLSCGVAAKVGDETTWQWATDLGTYPAVWIFVAVLFGHFSHSPAAAAAGAAVFSSAAVIGYYAWAVFVLGFGFSVNYPAIWLGASVTAAPLLSAAAWFGSHQRIPPWLFAAPIAALILSEGPLRQYWNDLTIGLPDGFPFHPVQALVSLVLALATIGLMTRTPADRAKALVLTIPLMLVVENAIDALRSLIGA